MLTLGCVFCLGATPKCLEECLVPLATGNFATAKQVVNLKTHFNSYLSGVFASLSPVNQKKFTQILSSIETYTPGEYVFNAAQIKRGTSMRLRASSWFVRSPALILAMAHEIEHIRDFLTRGQNVSVRSAEINAFTKQWEFIQSAFSKEDLILLKKDFPTHVDNADFTLLNNKKIIEEKNGVLRRVHTEKAGTEADREALARYLEARVTNLFFVTFVERALTQSKEEFVRAALLPYSGQFLRDDLKRVATLLTQTRLGNAALVAAILAAGGTFLVNLQPSQ